MLAIDRQSGNHLTIKSVGANFFFFLVPWNVQIYTWYLVCILNYLAVSALALVPIPPCASTLLRGEKGDCLRYAAGSLPGVQEQGCCVCPGAARP